MTKTQTWELVEQALKAHKANKKLVAELTELLAPKGKSIANEPFTNDDGVLMVWCVWHKEYEPSTEFRVSKTTKTGYHHECNVALKNWHHYAKLIKAKEAEMKGLVDKILEGEMEQTEAKALSENIKAEIAQLTQDRLNKITIL